MIKVNQGVCKGDGSCDRVEEVRGKVCVRVKGNTEIVRGKYNVMVKGVVRALSG